LVKKIQRDTKIGTAYEKYDTNYLWQLGDRIQSYSEAARNKDDCAADILLYLNKTDVKCPPVLLKNAETARRTWQKGSDYLNDVKDASYGKLKAIFPVLDPDFISQTSIPEVERKKLLENLNEITYKEVLARVKELRHVYDPASLSIDLDQFYSNLHSINSYLELVIKKPDTAALSSFRSRYSPHLINDVRMLIATMRSEETFIKLEKYLPKEIRMIPSSDNQFETWFSDIVRDLIALRRGTPNSRERIRKRIGVSKLGELITLLKAASSDEELKRYIRGRELLERIRNGTLGA
jgi:hypothetical protein